MTADFTKDTIDLAQPRLGSRVVFASDDFFGAKERLIGPKEPVFKPNKYDEHGKWMDGWESRRRRDAGHDHAIVRLGVAGILKGVDIDTRHFTGNYPPEASLEGCVSSEDEPREDTEWATLVPRRGLDGDSRHLIAVEHEAPVTHLRLSIFPDGGVARLRAYGTVAPDWSKIDLSKRLDLAALELGGRPVAANDEHFGRLENIIAPGRGRNMGDGWETRRRREPGHDWGVIALARPGVVEKLVIDTAFFKGNYPDRCSVQAALIEGGRADDIAAASADWPLLLPEQKMAADSEHGFKKELTDPGPVSHVRLNLFPDGGVSRFRVLGRVAS